MLREPAEPPAAEPKQSGSFRYLQGMLEASEGGKTPTLTPPDFPLPVGPPSRALAPHILPPSCAPLPQLLEHSHTSCCPPNFLSSLYGGSPRSRVQPHTPRSEVFPFSDLCLSAPGSCHPCSGFQESGRGLPAPGTSSPRLASWAPH